MRYGRTFFGENQGSFEIQYELLEKLEYQKIPFIKFDTLMGLSNHTQLLENVFGSHLEATLKSPWTDIVAELLQ